MTGPLSGPANGLLQVLDGSSPPSPQDMHDIMSGGTTALFNPCGLAVSTSGMVFVADTGHHRVCVVKDGKLDVLAGSGARGFADGFGQEASFSHPCGLAIDSEGNLYVADCGNHRIRQIQPDGLVTTVAGSGTTGHRDGHGRFASFYNPCGIAVDWNDVLYVADYSNNCVRVVSKGGVVATVKNTAGDTRLDAPYGIAVHQQQDENGASSPLILVSSYHSNSLATLSPDGHVEPLAGCGAARHADGAGADAAFHAPNGLAIDADGDIYVADSGNHCIRKVSRDGRVSTLAGNGLAALSDSQFNSPCGLCVCELPQFGPVLLVTDRSNSCVRVLPIDSLPPLRIAPSTLRQDMRALLNGGEDCIEGEAVFEVDQRTLRIPKAVLCVRCAHFRAMFTSGMREAQEGVVRLPNVSYSVFRALLDYLLTDELPEELEDANARCDLALDGALELMMLANAYGVQRLEQLCQQVLVKGISKQNVHEISRCAQLIGASQLQRASARCIAAAE